MARTIRVSHRSRSEGFMRFVAAPSSTRMDHGCARCRRGVGAPPKPAERSQAPRPPTTLPLTPTETIAAAVGVAVDRIRVARRGVGAARTTLVALSGIDGSGKGYVGARLVERLREHGLSAALL